MIVEHNGHRTVVEKSREHPENYLWIRVAGKLFFLGVLVKGMTRRTVRSTAIAFLDRYDAATNVAPDHSVPHQ